MLCNVNGLYMVVLQKYTDINGSSFLLTMVSYIIPTKAFLRQLYVRRTDFNEADMQSGRLLQLTGNSTGIIIRLKSFLL